MAVFYSNIIKTSYDYYNNGGKEGSTKQLAKRNKYISWGNDYAWLPSFTAIGDQYWNEENDLVIGYSGIWGMLPNHIGWSSASDNQWAWLRSGYGDYKNDYKYVYYLDSSGVNNYNSVDSSLGLRTAMHLNLSAIKRSFE